MLHQRFHFLQNSSCSVYSPYHITFHNENRPWPLRDHINITECLTVSYSTALDTFLDRICRMWIGNICKRNNFVDGFNRVFLFLEFLSSSIVTYLRVKLRISVLLVMFKWLFVVCLPNYCTIAGTEAFKHLDRFSSNKQSITCPHYVFFRCCKHSLIRMQHQLTSTAKLC